MITKAGLKCDVCGVFILGLTDNDNHYEEFSLTLSGRKQSRMHCHRDCKQPLVDLAEANDWNVLPEGPLKKAMRKSYPELEHQKSDSKEVEE